MEYFLHSSGPSSVRTEYWIIGYLISMLAGHFLIRPMMIPFKNEASDQVKDWISRKNGKGDDVIDSEPQEELRQAWKFVSNFDLSGGAMIAGVERTIYFISLLFGEVIPIVGWLTFKAAAKWDTWRNIVKVPEDSDPKDSNSENVVFHLDFVIRRYWGTLVMQRFVVGTGLNLIIAGGGIGIAYLLQHLCYLHVRL